MLGDKDAIATVAVRDLAAARTFYEDTLGLKVEHEEGDEALTFKTGSSKLIVYRSAYAGSNRATAINWLVGKEMEAIVQGLRAKGVTFEHYELPGLTRKGDLHVAGDLQAAWFKDLDGNIIALMNG